MYLNEPTAPQVARLRFFLTLICPRTDYREAGPSSTRPSKPPVLSSRGPCGGDFGLPYVFARSQALYRGKTQQFIEISSFACIIEYVHKYVRGTGG